MPPVFVTPTPTPEKPEPPRPLPYVRLCRAGCGRVLVGYRAAFMWCSACQKDKER